MTKEVKQEEKKTEVKPEPPKDAADLLGCVQRKLKAPKSQYNKFGQYHYRNCEDILEAVKPLLPPSAYMTISDTIQMIGDRFYVVATATLHYKGATVSNTAYAREALTKKGMDESQITGATSSYARKYALNGLFLIDDTKDADADDKSNSKDARDVKTAEVLGGSIKSHLDPEQVDQIYGQALKSLEGCIDFESLKKVWANQYKARNTYPADKWADIEQKYTECKAAFGIVEQPKQMNGVQH